MVLDRLAPIPTPDPELDPWFGPNGASRPAQRPPDGKWKTWLIMAGRGFGKTRTGAEFIRWRLQNWQLTRTHRITLAGPTSGDIHKVMLRGESGLLTILDREGIDYHYVQDKSVSIPTYRAEIVLVSAEHPDRFRGLQHDTVWADEIAAWRYLAYAWSQLVFGARLPGGPPQIVATTTPRPLKALKAIIANTSTRMTTGTTYENFGNLDETFHELLEQYEGTNMGRQELMGQLIEDVEGALWQSSRIDETRIHNPVIAAYLRANMKRIVVAVDPATTYGPGADLTGIAAAGVSDSEHVYVFAGYGLRVSPDAWARSAIQLYLDLEADCITAESNQGGEMVRKTILDTAKEMGVDVAVHLEHAKVGKRIRAEPVSALWEQGRGHVVGQLPELEDQMSSFTGDPTLDEEDDIVDALVHAVTKARNRKPRPKGQTKGH
jgi:phage terminase large subunit-like protein